MGQNTTYGFFYDPALGESGETSKNLFTAGLGRADARLGKEIWVGDPNYGTTFADAVAAIGSTPGTLILSPGNHVSTTAIPPTLTLRIPKGAKITVGNGATQTINGPVDAGPYQIFSCDGTGAVVFGEQAVGYAEWWGENTVAGTTNMTVPLQAAATALTKTLLLAQTYKVGVGGTDTSGGTLNYGIRVPNGHGIEGVGPESIIYQGTTGAAGILAGDDVTLHNFTLKGCDSVYAANSIGLIYSSYTGAPTRAWEDRVATDFTGLRVRVDKVNFEDWGADAIHTASYWSVTNCKIKDCYNEGILCSGGYNILIGNDLENLLSWGIDMNSSYNIAAKNIIYNCGQTGCVVPGDGGGIVLKSATPVMGCNNNNVMGNTIQGSGDTEVVAGETKGYNGIDVRSDADGNYAIYNNVIGNVIATAYVGINVKTTASGDVSNLIIKGNGIYYPVLKGMTLIGGIGEPITNISVSGNTIKGSTTTAYGIQFSELSGFKISNNLITNCVVTISTLGYGIYGADTNTKGSIDNNLVTDCTYGVYYGLTASTYINVTNNNLVSNTNAAAFTLAATNVVKDNLGYPDYRSSAGSPVGSVIPYYIGEEYLDTTGHWYKSTGLTNSDWIQIG